MKRIAQDGPVAEWLERGAKLMAPKSTKSSADTSRKAWTYETGRDHDQRDQINHAHARQLIRSAQHRHCGTSYGTCLPASFWHAEWFRSC